MELMGRYNLKLRKGKTFDDIRLTCGRGLNGAMHNTPKALEQIAEEIDKVCIIARWSAAVVRYCSK